MRKFISNKKGLFVALLIIILFSVFGIIAVTPGATDNIIEVVKGKDDTQSPTTNPNDSVVTCTEGINRILVDEMGLEQVEGSLVYQRGGAYNNQLQIDFTNNLLIFGDESINYFGDPYLDEYFHWVEPNRDNSLAKDKFRKAAINEGKFLIRTYHGDTNIVESVGFGESKTIQPGDVYPIRETWKQFLGNIHGKLESIGCPLKGYSPSIFSTYNKQAVKSEEYWNQNTLVHDPIEVMAGLGMDVGVWDMPQYVELSNWEDYKSINPYVTLPDGSMKNVGYILVLYDNSRFDVKQSVVAESQPFYDAKNYYKYVLSNESTSYNQLYTQNFFRDIYFKFALPDAPKVYFINGDLPANNQLTSDNGLPASNSLTIEEWKYSHSAVFQFMPKGDGVEYIGFAWIPDLHRVETVEWFMQYLDRSKFDRELLYEYSRVYDLSWQRLYGVREQYFDKYGF